MGKWQLETTKSRVIRFGITRHDRYGPPVSCSLSWQICFHTPDWPAENHDLQIIDQTGQHHSICPCPLPFQGFFLCLGPSHLSWRWRKIIWTLSYLYYFTWTRYRRVTVAFLVVADVAFICFVSCQCQISALSITVVNLKLVTTLTHRLIQPFFFYYSRKIIIRIDRDPFDADRFFD